MNDGLVVLCNLKNLAEPGDMPREVLYPLTQDGEVLEWSFEDRVIGYNRQYVAKGVSERVDMLIRIWRAPARIGMYAVLTDYEGQTNPAGDQYRIDNVQHLLDENGLKVTDLTLYRLEELYDVGQ
ncbi:MAG: hypothetical protein IJH64_04690 [Oscillospiraceae bacterium]|nr:hypothetical protein [Oscillospiraceae bacterium]